MSEEECSELLDKIPLYAVASPAGSTVVLKAPGSSKAMVHFYLSRRMANQTMHELVKAQPELELKLAVFRLGQVYFKVLKNETDAGARVVDVSSEQKEGAAGAAGADGAGGAGGGGEEAVEYRLVPDTRDLVGARMLLTIDGSDGEEMRAAGKMTDELARKALERAMTSERFNETHGNVPVFLIQQMRVKTQGEGGAAGKTMTPLYLSLADMVSTWQRFAGGSEEAAAAEPAIHIMDLDELVAGMRRGGKVDFSSVLLIPGDVMGQQQQQQQQQGGAKLPEKGMGGMGGQTLGDL
jgi:hypothetical protein